MSATVTAIDKALAGSPLFRRLAAERDAAASRAEGAAIEGLKAALDDMATLLRQALAAQENHSTALLKAVSADKGSDRDVVKALGKLSADIKASKPAPAKEMPDRTNEVVAAINSLREGLASVVETLMAPVDLETNNYGEPVSAQRRAKGKKK